MKEKGIDMTVEEHERSCRPAIDQKFNSLEQVISQRIENIESHIEEITRMIEGMIDRENDRHSRITALQLEIVEMKGQISELRHKAEKNNPTHLIATATSILSFLAILALVLGKLT